VRCRFANLFGLNLSSLGRLLRRRPEPGIGHPPRAARTSRESRPCQNGLIRPWWACLHRERRNIEDLPIASEAPSRRSASCSSCEPSSRKNVRRGDGFHDRLWILGQRRSRRPRSTRQDDAESQPRIGLSCPVFHLQMVHGSGRDNDVEAHPDSRGPRRSPRYQHVRGILNPGM
jgi:hypothetical protein